MTPLGESSDGKERWINSGIYLIVNSVTRRAYAGSTNDLKNRKWAHWGLLRRGEHSNPLLQRAWNKYGEGAFFFEVVECCKPTREFLLEREDWWIELLSLRSRKKGYNLRGAQRVEFSEETRQKMSSTRKERGLKPPSPKGRTVSEKCRRQTAEANRQRQWSEVSRQKLSESQRGKKLTEKHKARISEGNKGKRQMSEKTKEKLRAISKERVLTEKEIERLRSMAGNRKGKPGKPFTEDCKARMSEARKGRVPWNKGMTGGTWSKARRESHARKKDERE